MTITMTSEDYARQCDAVLVQLSSSVDIITPTGFISGEEARSAALMTAQIAATQSVAAAIREHTAAMQAAFVPMVREDAPDA